MRRASLLGPRLRAADARRDRLAQGLWNGANESAFNNGTAQRTCQCDLRCEARRDCCCDVNYWRGRGRWAVVRDGVDPGLA